MGVGILYCDESFNTRLAPDLTVPHTLCEQGSGKEIRVDHCDHIKPVWIRGKKKRVDVWAGKVPQYSDNQGFYSLHIADSIKDCLCVI